ncbi:ephrin type-A receptor 4-A-like [Stylophora pistillata]|uniref:receptor protein-tyrosine kinase n=1 Tax=Stylophora pistillata TaxID=50429 RepID=A0A2B4R8F9_STYPI|nr:ephrin type-A receptor 4-A-like [Stylophora pistillata]PFX13113.1 Tyrosine kinase receptor Cad96Ca [Stylophora pistillata]
MDHWLLSTCILLWVFTFSSAEVVILEKQPTQSENSNWQPSKPPTTNSGPTGWVKRTFYSTCDVSLDAFPRPNNWLRSNPIEVHSGVNAVYITTEFRIKNCSSYPDNGGKYCTEYLGLYVFRSSRNSEPNPLTNNASYEKIAKIAAPAFGFNITQTFRAAVTGKYLVLAFHDEGSCSDLFSVTVKYYVCPELSHVGGLVSLPRTVAPASDSEPVVGGCVTNAVTEQGILSANCQSDGAWNITSLKGRCVCMEDMENVRGECKDCPVGKYNNQNGLNCTVLPSAPKGVKVAFLNQSAVEISWQPPMVTGDETHVLYDVECRIRKICGIGEVNNCVHGDCGILNTTDLEINHLIVAGLSSLTSYTFKIFAKNRVSEVAKRKHRVEWNFATLNFGTNGSDAFSSTKTSGIEEDPRVTKHLKTVYVLVGLLGLLIFCIMVFVCYKVWRRWRPSGNGNCAKESNEEGFDNFEMIGSEKLDREQIVTVKVLGSGNFGQVCKAFYVPRNADVAVKSLKDDATPKDKQDFHSELNLMKSLVPHSHVVKLYGYCVEKVPHLIVLEYLPYGDLLGYLRKSRGIEDSQHTGEKEPILKLSEKDLLSFAWMIADGMNYLSSMKIVHRDLAARNVLVGENKVCKISDFGLARRLEGDIYTTKSEALLPIKWMPPESLVNGISSTMSDVWSYGIVMWEVFTVGESPYPKIGSRKVKDLLREGYRMPRPEHISQELYSIMSECWEDDPKKRPTFPWLCAAVKRLLNDHKIYVNLEVYDGTNYVNFDMMMDYE